MEVHIRRSADRSKVVDARGNQESRSSIDQAITLRRLHKFPAFVKGVGARATVYGLSDYRAKGSLMKDPVQRITG